jgi:hypothetical protein
MILAPQEQWRQAARLAWYHPSPESDHDDLSQRPSESGCRPGQWRVTGRSTVTVQITVMAVTVSRSRTPAGRRRRGRPRDGALGLRPAGQLFKLGGPGRIRVGDAQPIRLGPPNSGPALARTGSLAPGPGGQGS